MQKLNAFRHTVRLSALCFLAGTLQSNAAQLARELWDNVPAGQLKGAGNGTSSLGFPAGAKWNVNAPGTNNLLIDTGNDVQNWQLAIYNYPLPVPSATAIGTLSLANNITNFDSGCWAVRLASTPLVNFSSDNTVYFSAQFVKRGLWYDSNGTAPGGTNGYGSDDAAIGMGFAAGSSSTSAFVGAGVTRSVAANGGAGYLVNGTDIGDTPYITTGTLGQAGLGGHPTDSGGPYYVSAYNTNFLQEIEGYINGYPNIENAYLNGGFLVGRIITTSGGATELDAKVFWANGDLLPVDPSTVTWDVTYHFTQTGSMQYLLVWMNGINQANPCRLDAIRVANTWAEAVGEEIVGPPSVSPTNNVYEGTPLTLSIFTDVDPAGGTYQWLKNGTNLPGAASTNTIVLSSPTPGDSGNYSVIFGNYYGGYVTSSVTAVTVRPAIPPFQVNAPSPVTRYAGASSASMTPVFDGAQPFSYQWKHVVGGVTNLVTDQTNQALLLTNLLAGDAGDYFVTVTNFAGKTNSASATLTILVPAPGSFAEGVVSNGPFAYWRMDETNGTVLHDYFGGYDGAILDPTNMTVGINGVAGQGFPNPHRGMFLPNNGHFDRVNMPAIPAWTNEMTLCCWLMTPSAPTVNGILYTRDTVNYAGNASGLAFVGQLNGTQGLLGYQWGSGYTWSSSGLYVPLNTWTFVALVLNGTQASLYMGTNGAPLTAAHADLPASLDTAFPGNTYSNSFPLLIGRTGWPWAEDPNNAWANANLNISDVAVFYSALPATNIYSLYLAALGELVTYEQSGSSLTLSWPVGSLLSATQVQGPYTNVSGAVSPFPTTISGQRFYRVQR